MKNPDASIVIELNPNTNRYYVAIVTGPDDLKIEVSQDLSAYEFYSKPAKDLIKAINLAAYIAQGRNAILGDSSAENAVHS